MPSKSNNIRNKHVSGYAIGRRMETVTCFWGVEFDISRLSHHYFVLVTAMVLVKLPITNASHHASSTNTSKPHLFLLHVTQASQSPLSPLYASIQATFLDTASTLLSTTEISNMHAILFGKTVCEVAKEQFECNLPLAKLLAGDSGLRMLRRTGAQAEEAFELTNVRTFWCCVPKREIYVSVVFSACL